jgi:hypothetical protein
LLLLIPLPGAILLVLLKLTAAAGDGALPALRLEQLKLFAVHPVFFLR